MKKYAIALLVMIIGVAVTYLIIGKDHMMSHHALEDGKIHAITAYITEPVPNAQAAAAYLTLVNKTDQADTLLAADGVFASKIEIHNMSMDGDVMRMRQLPDGLALAANEKVTLAPGGLHLMLMGLKSKLNAGEKVSIRLSFENFDAVDVEAIVIERGQQPEMDHH